VVAQIATAHSTADRPALGAWNREHPAEHEIRKHCDTAQNRGKNVTRWRSLPYGRDGSSAAASNSNSPAVRLVIPKPWARSVGPTPEGTRARTRRRLPRRVGSSQGKSRGSRHHHPGTAEPRARTRDPHHGQRPRTGRSDWPADPVPAVDAPSPARPVCDRSAWPPPRAGLLGRGARPPDQG
jgi:hypothetical protein